MAGADGPYAIAYVDIVGADVLADAEASAYAADPRWR
jgi:hypothetical protein